MDDFAIFKQDQRSAWEKFGPKEALTTPVAARLVRHAGIASGQRVLDVCCGTGVVAVTAARRGAYVTGLDLTPALLERARENGSIAEVDVAWHEGDVEALPFPEAEFDVVVSQFGHIFAPRPAVATAEMLRVLRPGGTIAFATWPPEMMPGRMFQLTSRYLPLPSGVADPVEWGEPETIRRRLGAAVTGIRFARAAMFAPMLSPQHYRVNAEAGAGPARALAQHLHSQPEQLTAFRRELEALAKEFGGGNCIRQDYLLTRGRKR